MAAPTPNGGQVECKNRYCVRYARPMSSSAPAPSIVYTPAPGEELANTISHGLGLLLAIAGLPVLIVSAVHSGGATSVVTATVFGLSMILLYLASTLYHATSHPRLKSLLQQLDHAAIYLLIAGTYTPIALGVLPGGWGWTMFGVAWGLALLGVGFKFLVRAQPSWLSTVLYVAMGWLALVAIRPLWLHMAPGGLAWLFAGGVVYTLGVVFFMLDERVRYCHSIWHCFVLGGTACHFFAILLFVY